MCKAEYLVGVFFFLIPKEKLFCFIRSLIEIFLFLFFFFKVETAAIIWSSTVYEDHVYERRFPFKETHSSFVQPFIVWMQMFLFFCHWNLAPHPLPRPAREIAQSESIQKDQGRDCCSPELSLN